MKWQITIQGVSDEAVPVFRERVMLERQPLWASKIEVIPTRNDRNSY
jgi:hypothetical protein